jgi:hypothetical protein
MASASHRTATDLADFLQRNDGERKHLDVDRTLLEGMAEWSGSDHREVMDAAAESTLSEIIVRTPGLSEAKAVVVSCMLGRLRCLKVFEMSGTPDAVPEAVVDNLLNGMTQSRSSNVSTFKISASGGPCAFIDFAKRFPCIERLVLGFRNEAMILSARFATALAIAIAKGYLGSLGCLQLHCQVALQETSRLVHSLHSAPLREFSLIVSKQTQNLLEDASFLCATTKK